MKENNEFPRRPSVQPSQPMTNDQQPNGHSPTQWSSIKPAAYHSQTVGERGPVLEQDSVLHETLETFIHEKMLERPVHVKGYGAFGYFQTVHSMAAGIHSALLSAESWPASPCNRKVFLCCKQQRHPGHSPQCAWILHQVLYGQRCF